MQNINFPIRYVPDKLTKTDKQKQVNMLLKSKKLYKKINIIRAKIYDLTKI